MSESDVNLLIGVVALWGLINWGGVCWLAAQLDRTNDRVNRLDAVLLAHMKDAAAHRRESKP